MSDAVFDASVVMLSNKDIAARRPGNSFDRRLGLLDIAVQGRLRIRYNTRLLVEYEAHVKKYNNDVMELFFRILDSPSAVRVGRNALSRQDHARAVGQRWPNHDQHLLAAAIGGNQPSIFVTEPRLAVCGAGIQRVFGIRVARV